MKGRFANATLIACLAGSLCGPTQAAGDEPPVIELGDRPASLQALLPDGALRKRFEHCRVDTATPQSFSIAHRGSPLHLPEHTEQGYREAARQGAGFIECDVTFTADRELVCRHSQCDLHTTTDILATPLANKCSVPPRWNSSRPFKNVRCCTSDLTLAEFRSLRGKRDGGNRRARNVDEFLAGTPAWQSDPNVDFGTLMTHRESVRLFDELGVNMIPELKQAQVRLPFEGDYTRKDFVQQVINDYRAEGVSSSRVRVQSFLLDDLRLLLDIAPEFGEGFVYLDGRYSRATFNVDRATSWRPTMSALREAGVAFLAPPIWMLITLDDDARIVPSAYALAARKADLRLLAWSLERSVDVKDGGGWYYQSIRSAFDDEADQLKVLDVLAGQVGVEGVFSDWPATTTWFSHCVL